MLGRDPAALVADAYQAAAVVGGRHPDCLPRLAVLDGVVDEVDHRLLEQWAVDGGGEIGRALDVELDRPLDRPRPAVFGRGRKDRQERLGLHRQRAGSLALFDPRQRQEILDDRREPVRLAGDDLEEAAVVGRVIRRSVEERLHEALDRRDGRLQFVRHVGDKVAADVLQPLHVGDVVEHDHRSPFARRVAQGRAAEADRAVADPVEDQIVLDRLAAVDCQQREAAEIRIADHLLQGAADDPLQIDVEQVGGRPVDAQHPLPGVDRHDALDHAAEDGLLLGALAADRQAALDELFAEQAEGGGDVGELHQVGGRERSVDMAGGELHGGVPQLGHRPRRAAGD